jgi:hypothetical protein
MAITDLSSFTSKQGVTTAVWRYDEADTFVVQHDFMHLSFYKDDFREFVDTLLVAVRQIDKAQDPVSHIHPVVLLSETPRDPGVNPGEQSTQPSAASSHHITPQP